MTIAKPTVTFGLDALKKIALARGYRIEVDADGTERLIRPDGTVAMIAHKGEKESER
jgi:hypothetical protein